MGQGLSSVNEEAKRNEYFSQINQIVVTRGKLIP
jgi:hypothetical protein